MNIAFVIDNLANSQIAYEVIQFVNSCTKKKNNINPMIFFQNNAPPVINPACMSMNISGLSGFRGIAVAVGLESLDIVEKNNSSTKNWLFVWDLQWLHSTVDYCRCLEALKHFNIVCRSESHKKVVKNFTGRNDIFVAYDADGLYECLMQTK